MKKILASIVLGFTAMATAQQPASPAPAAQPGAQQSAQPGSQPAQQKKEIKDPAEYNAYMGAFQQQDPNAKISGLEAFVTQYPNSVMKEDALEALMGAYQQTGNAAKMEDAAQRLLKANPNNVRPLALLAYMKRTAAQAGQNPQQNLADAKQYGQQGLQALESFNKPDGVSDADYQKLKTQMSGIFNGAVGIAALQDKDYATAIKGLRAAVDATPSDFSLVYPLALAYLSAPAPDYLNGIWFSARAAGMAPQPQLQQQIEKYGKSQYTKYHGSDQGWTDVLAQAKASPTPPQGFTITQYVPPTPAEQAADLVKTKKPEDMDFGEWELVLSAGKPEDADKVWSALKGKPLQMKATVISATPTKLEIAASVDDIEKKRTDVMLEMSGPIPAAKLPKEGDEFAFQGTPDSYDASPFVMHMTQGALLEQKAPKAAPTKKTPVRRRPAKSR